VDTFVKQGGDPITCILESNLNHEISYYPYVSYMETVATLPDIVVSSDFNSFFHHRFYDRFVKPGNFIDVTDYEPQESFVKAGIPDPEKNVTVVCVNPLIVVADLEKTGDRPLPRRWEDLLHPIWKQDITLRGGEQFFCHAVLLPFYKAFGGLAMEALARNVYDGRHPSQMVKTAGTGRSAALYVMPYFFARKIPSNRKVQVVWPEDGALASPVTVMVKKDKAAKLKPVTDYLTGEAMARVFAGAGFPSPHPAVVNDIPESSGLNWLGWDYMRENDLEALNKAIDRIFLPAVYPGIIV
jgi:ABC-type Fe3+ transport system substrate-binding protein